MRVLWIVSLCIASPLVITGILFWFGDALTRYSGLGRLAKLYPANGRIPQNTRMRTFSINMLGHSAGGSAGADERGLYVHGGYEGTEFLIPWSQLEKIVRLGPRVVFRERETGFWLSVARELAQFRPDDTPSQC